MILEIPPDKANIGVSAYQLLPEYQHLPNHIQHLLMQIVSRKPVDG